MRSSLPLRIAALATVLALGGLTGCGSPGDAVDAPPADPAPKVSQAAGEAEPPAEGDEAAPSLDGDYAFGLDRDQMRETIEETFPGSTASWEGDTLVLAIDGDATADFAGHTECRVLQQLLEEGDSVVIEFPNGRVACEKDDESPSEAEQASNEQEQAPDEQQAAEGAKTATFTWGDTSYSFTLSVCIIDETDAVISGVGTDDATGEPAYLHVDFYSLDVDPGGGFNIHVGTDQAFDHSNQRGEYSFVTEMSGETGHIIVADENSISVEAEVPYYAETGDEQISAPGTLEVACR